MNSVHLIGRLVRDPELKNSGEKAVSRYTVAIDRGKEQTDFIPIVSFGKTAELLVKYTKKGSLIAVEGDLHSNRYEKDGKVNYSLDVIGQKIQFLTPKSQEENEKNIKNENPDFPENDDEALPF